MYKVLIVDDEKHVRMWIRNSIDWESFGFEIVAEAKNGEEALIKIEHTNPQLVVSDMDMPDMDGSELLEKTHMISPKVMFIIISGYSDFKYIKSAVKNNAIDYLMKPVKSEEMIDAIERVKKRLYEIDAKDKIINEIHDIKKKNKHIEQESFMFSIIKGRVFQSISIEDDLAKRELVFDKKLFAVIILRTNNTDLRNDSNLSNTFMKCAENYKFRAFAFSDNEDLIGILNFNDKNIENDNVVEAFCKSVLRRTHKEYNLTITISIGNFVKNINLLSESYQNAKKYFGLKMISGEKNIFKEPKNHGSFKSVLVSREVEEKLMIALKTQNFERCKEIIDEIITKIKNLSQINYNSIRACYNRIIMIFLNALYEKGYSTTVLGLDEVEMFASFEKMTSISLVEKKLYEYIEAILDVFSRSEDMKSAIDQVKSYIIEHLGEDISLTEISEYVHLTPNYLCALFREKANEKIFNYISRQRVDKAKVLLKNSKMKIKEISQLVGYNDTRYFGKVFKNYTGQTPSEYRKSI